MAIRYGKNLTDLTQEENCNNVFTAIYPFWYSDEEGLVELPDKIINAPGEYNYTRIYTLDLSQDFSAKPTVEQLGELAELYMSVLNIGVPEVSLSVAFQPLAMTEEYKDYAVLETVRLGDVVTVEFPKLKVNSTARCYKTIYNSITDKYVNIELGDYRPNLVDTLIAHGNAIADSPTRVYIKDAIDRATQLITGGLGGHVVIHNSVGESHPNEILIMDSPDIATANRVWRWNSGGLG